MASSLGMPNPPKRSNYARVLVVILCSVLLGGGSCFGFLATLNVNRSTPLNLFFTIGFIVCVAVFLVSIVWLIVKAVRDGLKNQGGRP